MKTPMKASAEGYREGACAALAEVNRIHRIAEEDRASMSAMVHLDEVVTAMGLLVATAEDRLREGSG